MTFDQWLQQDISSTPNPLPPLVPPATPDYQMPTARALSRAVGSLETYRDLTLAQFRRRMQEARLEAFCLGKVPIRRGFPRTSMATCDADVVTT